VLNLFKELDRKHPQRESGSPGAAKLAQAIINQASALNLKAVTGRIKVFHFQSSLLSFGLGSLITILVGIHLPLLGLILQAILWLLLLREFKQPALARLMPGETKNIAVTIPARSKEVQKIILTVPFDTSAFMPTPLGLKPQLYWGLILFLGSAVLGLQLSGILLGFPPLLFWSLLPLLLLVVSGVLPKKQRVPSGLVGCSALLECASILTRFRPSITTVILYFTGAQALNSGVQKLPGLFKGDSPTYGLNLSPQDRPEIEIITREGFLPQSGSPLLKELLTEVAAEKSIPIKCITTSEVTPSYPFLAKKLDVISLGIPTKETNENLRELIVGFIRKIEH